MSSNAATCRIWCAARRLDRLEEPAGAELDELVEQARHAADRARRARRTGPAAGEPLPLRRRVVAASVARPQRLEHASSASADDRRPRRGTSRRRRRATVVRQPGARRRPAPAARRRRSSDAEIGDGLAVQLLRNAERRPAAGRRWHRPRRVGVADPARASARNSGGAGCRSSGRAAGDPGRGHVSVAGSGARSGRSSASESINASKSSTEIDSPPTVAASSAADAGWAVAGAASGEGSDEPSEPAGRRHGDDSRPRTYRPRVIGDGSPAGSARAGT